MRGAREARAGRRGPAVTLSDAEAERYSAQLGDPAWGPAAQRRLAAASAIVVGAGSSGALVAAHLASAGVGRIGIVDGAAIALEGLARQTLHFTPELGSNRAEGVAVKLGALNPEVVAEPYPVPADAANAEAIVTGADVVVECTGSSGARATVNAAACATGVSLVIGAAHGLAGFALSVRPGASACWACVGELGAAPRPAEGPARGTLAAVGGLVASIQALEALKLLAGVGRPLFDRLLRIDAAAMEPRAEGIARAPGCPACADLGAPPQSGS